MNTHSASFADIVIEFSDCVVFLLAERNFAQILFGWRILQPFQIFLDPREHDGQGSHIFIVGAKDGHDFGWCVPAPVTEDGKSCPFNVEARDQTDSLVVELSVWSILMTMSVELMLVSKPLFKAQTI